RVGIAVEQALRTLLRFSVECRVVVICHAEIEYAAAVVGERGCVRANLEDTQACTWRQGCLRAPDQLAQRPAHLFTRLRPQDLPHQGCRRSIRRAGLVRGGTLEYLGQMQSYTPYGVYDM